MSTRYENAAPLPAGMYPADHGPMEIIIWKHRQMTVLIMLCGPVICTATTFILAPFVGFDLFIFLKLAGVCVGVSIMAGFVYGMSWMLYEALPGLEHTPPPAVETVEVPSLPVRTQSDRIIFTNNPVAPPQLRDRPNPDIPPPEMPQVRLLNGCNEKDILYFAEWVIKTGDATQRAWDGKAIPTGTCSKEYHSQLCTTLQDYLKVMEGFGPRATGHMIVDEMDVIRFQLRSAFAKLYR